MAKKGKYDYNFDGHLVLIVEDNLISFKLLRTLMGKVNLEFIHATNGLEAINYCRERQDIDLVLMDIQLPELNGLEATRIITEMRPDLPVIATTANTFNEDYDACMEAGCSGYISKPITNERLFSIIQSILK